MYLDANNLNGHSMSKPLPYKNFKWSNDLTLDPNNLQLDQNTKNTKTIN